MGVKVVFLEERDMENWMDLHCMRQLQLVCMCPDDVDDFVRAKSLVGKLDRGSVGGDVLVT